MMIGTVMNVSLYLTGVSLLVLGYIIGRGSIQHENKNTIKHEVEEANRALIAYAMNQKWPTANITVNTNAMINCIDHRGLKFIGKLAIKITPNLIQTQAVEKVATELQNVLNKRSGEPKLQYELVVIGHDIHIVVLNGSELVKAELIKQLQVGFDQADVKVTIC
jgi:hypothetical protein